MPLEHPRKDHSGNGERRFHWPADQNLHAIDAVARRRSGRDRMQNENKALLLHMREEGFECGVVKRPSTSCARQGDGAEAELLHRTAQLVDHPTGIDEARDGYGLKQALCIRSNCRLLSVQSVHPLSGSNAARPGDLSWWRPEQLPLYLASL